MVLCGRWFSKNRGKSVAFTSLGFAFGEAFLPIIFVSIIGIYGWRSTWGIAFIILILISGTKIDPVSQKTSSRFASNLFLETLKDEFFNWIFSLNVKFGKSMIFVSGCIIAIL